LTQVEGGMLREFREFASRGNVMDLAIGVIIGGAFGKIINSMVNDMLMPAVGLLLGKVDFSNLFVVLGMGPSRRSRTRRRPVWRHSATGCSSTA